jgi:hypothetical protein
MINSLRYLFLIVWAGGLLGVVAFGVVVVILKWMRRRKQLYIGVDYGFGLDISFQSRLNRQLVILDKYWSALRVEHAKPLPAAVRTICTCICGRLIPEYELHCLIVPPKCPLCGSTLRRWQYVYPSWFDKFAAAFRQMLWKRRHNKKR